VRSGTRVKRTRRLLVVKVKLVDERDKYLHATTNTYTNKDKEATTDMSGGQVDRYKFLAVVDFLFRQVPKKVLPVTSFTHVAHVRVHASSTPK
jgi:hypothetical protein